MKAKATKFTGCPKCKRTLIHYFDSTTKTEAIIHVLLGLLSRLSYDPVLTKLEVNSMTTLLEAYLKERQNNDLFWLGRPSSKSTSDLDSLRP